MRVFSKSSKTHYFATGVRSDGTILCSEFMMPPDYRLKRSNRRIILNDGVPGLSGEKYPGISGRYWGAIKNVLRNVSRWIPHIIDFISHLSGTLQQTLATNIGYLYVRRYTIKYSADGIVGVASLMPSSGLVAGTGAMSGGNPSKSCYSGICTDDRLLPIVLSRNRFLNKGIAENITSQTTVSIVQNDPLLKWCDRSWGCRTFRTL